MNQDDAVLLDAIAERIAAATLLPLDALKTAYALGVAREITDQAREPEEGTER